MIKMDDTYGKQPDEITHTNHSHNQRESVLKRLARIKGMCAQ